MVPVTVRLPAAVANALKSLVLIVDRNPAPVAATFVFGDGFRASTNIGERVLATRVRVDSFSKVRAVVVTSDGKLYMASKFVAGSGGCSSPGAKDIDAALAQLGKVQIKTLGDANRGSSWREGVVMIRHPNYTGMQMNPKTGAYTPARFVRDIEVRRVGAVVFRMEGGNSLSEDPNIRFTYEGSHDDVIELRATDTEGATFSGRSMPAGGS